MSTLDSTLSNSEVTSVNEQGLDVVAVVDPIEAEPTTFSTEENPIFTTFVAEANDGSVTPTQGVDATINLPDVMATATVTSNPTDNSANVAPVNGATPTQGIDATINLPAPNGMTTSMPAIHVANVESVALSSPVVEGSPSVFSVSLNNPCDVPTTVQLQLASDTATLGADFSNALEVSFDGKTWQSISNGNVIVPTGGSHFYARVPTIDDTLVEGTEKYTLTASANGSVASANGIITDNDVAAPLTPTATIGSISNATVTEGEKAVFQVTLANPNTAPTTVQFTPGAGSATPGADFTPDLEVSYDNGQTWSAVNPNGATNVPGGTVQFLVRHSTIDDTSVEPLENYTLTASANGTSQTGTGKIKDNDVLLPTAKIGSITNATVTEGQAAVFNVSLTDVNGAPSSVKLNLSDINATLGADYGGVEVSFDGQTWQSLTGDTVNLAGDATGFQVRVATNDDTLVEGTEKFTLTASTNGSTGTGTGTLLDNDKPTTIGSISNATVTEGEKAVFQVTLANPNTAPTTVQFTPGAGSATPGADFTPDLEVSYDNGQTWSAVNPNGATNVPGGTVQFLVRHSTIDDTSVEPLENYTLTASANGTSQTGTGKIKDNDVLLPTAKIGSITNATVTEGQAAVFNVSLTDVNGAPSSVKLNLSDINATLGADYGGVEVSFDGQTWQSLTGDTVNLAGDATGFQVRVATNDDTLVEGTEKFTLTASTNGSTGTGTGTLLDNDKLAPTAKLVGTTSLIEGDRGSYQIQLDQVSDKDRIFTIQIDDGSAKRYDGNGSGQDIMSGGAYDYASIGKVIVGRVSNGTFSYSDRAMVGVGDASWDYTVKNSQGQINTGNTIQVKVAAGQTTSEAFSVQSWKEKVTVDRDYRGPQYTGSAVEGTENFSLKVVDGGDTTVTQGTVNVSIKDATKYNYISPIAIDLNGDGVQTVSVNDGVTFDILNIGQRVATGWISGDDGFLAVDNNGNGSIDNRDELFGGGVGEGFAKLDSFDSNRDGVVDEKDTDWQKLKIWQDKNVNGVTDAGELNNLSSYGIASLNVAHTNDFSKDAQGNILGERSTAIGTNGQSMDMIDVYFKLG
jgi:hypothetical protein